jgi:hypothetical protein
VHLLTLQALPRGQLLLRLAHLYQVAGTPHHRFLAVALLATMLIYLHHAACCLTARKSRQFRDDVLHGSFVRLVVSWPQTGEDEVLSKDATVDLARLLTAVTGGRAYHRGGALPAQAHVLQGGLGTPCRFTHGMCQAPVGGCGWSDST